MTLDNQNESLLSQSANNIRNKDFTLSLNKAINSAKKNLLSKQSNDGHWVYELEADCTIPAEYILMNHFTGEIDNDKEEKIAVYHIKIENQDKIEVGKFEGKVAVVTGGAWGIGGATGRKLASEGAKVTIADIDDDAINTASSMSIRGVPTVVILKKGQEVSMHGKKIANQNNVFDINDN